ncbi:MAG: type II CRISPR RNA-guided endonuclease Cas9 [Candidatus Nealsonbacteria bacterium]|nr:type II CRISPR RNA-guided endonuclease Cas9 [Candidatus Nealsonbacteria bacterium]
MASRGVLGLDLGPNSIGWALIDEEEEAIVDIGVRVFPEGVDNFDTAKEVSKNEDRRISRGMRRQAERRCRRRRQIRDALVEAGLFPAEPERQEALLASDPYELRSRALDKKLSPHELGRVFCHLGQRRGFLSNRKKDRGDKEVKGMLAEISELEGEMKEAGAETLGRLLYRKAQSLDHASRRENDHLRNRHTRRKMYEDEFEAIWQSQCRLGNDGLLTDDLKYGKFKPKRGHEQLYPRKPARRPAGLSPLEAFGIHGLIFFQRKMYWPRSAVGTCELEPKQPRCARADRRAQRFRLLQEVNNLRYSDLETSEEERLSGEQRTLLLDKLSQSAKVTFDQIRKTLGFMESVKFNLEKGKRPGLQGMIVDALMAKAVGEAWHARDERQKDDIVRLLINNEREDDELAERLVDRFGMTAAEAEAALDVDFPSGHVHLSLKAIDKLLPHLERGLILQSESDPEKSALHAAGYLRRDELKRRLFDRLPDPQRARDCPIGDTPNPVVKRTLVELRKVVNAIVREHGTPAAIHVEMGRDVRTRPKRGTDAYRKYQDRIDEMRTREKRRADAAEKLRESSIRVNRDNINRYLLWEDQNRTCIYSGKPIGFGQLFGGEIQVDHVLPYSRCLDDSQNNKVVCFGKTNADKGNRTPYEWLADAQSDHYEQVCQLAGKLMHDGRIPYAKYRRFVQKELKLDDFIERQLNDTRYIARLAGEYLRCLFEADHHVLGVKGQLTATLRHDWGIENLLEELPDSPAWQDSSKLRPGQKNRADHRHHAIDAAVVALTNRRRLAELASIRMAGGTEATGELAVDPWLSFRSDLLDAVREVKVSHRADRKVSGRLHEEMFYGKTERPDVWVLRKKVEELSPSEVPNIRDREIREIIIARLRTYGIQVGRKQGKDEKKWKQAMAGLTMPSGVPIKKVRVCKKDGTILSIREGTDNAAFVKPGKTHHLCIFEFSEKGKTKREPVFVTMLEAIGRVKRGETVIQRNHPQRPEAEFVMSLSRGEIVLAEMNGEEKLLVYRTGASTSGQIRFAEHTDARKGSDYKILRATANSLKARKVTVDPLGRIRWAND